MLGIMLLVPMMFVIFNVDPTTATIGTMAVNLGMLFYLRKSFKNVASGFGLSGSKIKFQCLVCQGTKFDSRGTCVRCGSKARKSI